MIADSQVIIIMFIFRNLRKKYCLFLLRIPMIYFKRLFELKLIFNADFSDFWYTNTNQIWYCEFINSRLM